MGEARAEGCLQGARQGQEGHPHVLFCPLCLLLKAECFSLAKKLAFNQAGTFLACTAADSSSNGQGLPRATLASFLSLHRPTPELHGLPESTGIHTLSRQQDFRLLRWVLAEGRPGQPVCLLSSALLPASACASKGK